MTSRALAALDQKTFSIPAYKSIKAGAGSLVAAYGPPGSGKSTMLYRWAESLAPSLILPFEEGLSPSVGERLRRLEIRREDVFLDLPRSLNDLLATVKEHDPFLIVIDSAQACALTPDDLLSVARSRRGSLAVALQVNKDGRAAGSNEYIHLADVVIRVDAMQWTVEKSRFQDAGINGEVLP